MRSKPTHIKRGEKRLRVLIVEDSAQTRENLDSVLSVFPHLEVIGAAKDGLEAVEAIRVHEPDVITLDIHLPKMSGLAVLRAIREKKLKGEVIVLTAMADEFYRMKCLDLRVRHFFDKITQFDQFVKHMEAL